jgi:signal transduction histidine kinase
MTLPKPDSPKILLVASHPDAPATLRQLLAQREAEAEFQTIVASSGEEALRYAAQQDFAVILLDLQHAQKEGEALAAALHARPRTSSTAVIFIMAYSDEAVAALANYQAGTVDVLFTPVIPHLLKAKIAPFIELAHKNTLLKQQNGELMSTNQRLEHEISQRQIVARQSSAKDDFLGLLGHELRNPLSAITSAASIVTIKNVSPEKAERAKSIIRRQSANASRMVDDLLDLGRAMSGKIVLSRQPVEIARLIENCLEPFRVSGRCADLALTVNTETAMVDADPVRLEQIISSLIDNALKSIPATGAVDIAARIEGEQMVIAVRDGGAGIPADLLPHMFDVFGQGDSSVDRTRGGLGIGLALIRELVELHGGSVRADSAGPDTGSTFTVRLPLARTEIKTAPVDVEQKCTVLLIEDNDDGREMMCMLLTSFGNHVLDAENGKEGLRLAATGKPDIALIDIGLPGIDGYEVARRLRADPATAGMRLVALTGHGLAEDQHRALEAGFDMHLVKPISAEQLLKATTLPPASAGASRS